MVDGERECGGDPVQSEVSYTRYEPQLSAFVFHLNANFDSRASPVRLDMC